jgi:hypothetical protein
VPPSFSVSERSRAMPDRNECGVCDTYAAAAVRGDRCRGS